MLGIGYLKIELRQKEHGYVMSVDVKNINLMDEEASALVVKLLKGDVEWLSEQDKFVLTKNRKEIIQHLDTIFSKEIPLLLKGEACSDPSTLFWGLKLAGFFEASETFEWIEKLCHLSIENLDRSLADDFVTEELSYLLADTMNQWSVLKDIIERPDIDEFIRGACLDALIFSVAKNRINRLEITDYFKNLFHRIIIGELDDDLLCTHLVSSCSDFWPGECLEEIREAYGLTLVDESLIDFESTFEDFLLGKEACIERLQKQIKKHRSWDSLPTPPDQFDEEQSQKFNQLFQWTDQAKAHTDRILNKMNKGSQRNEICGCGSGRKYKKCCMNEPSQELIPKVIIKQSAITYKPLEEPEPMKALPKEVKESILALYPLVEENPEKVLQEAPQYISQYPDIHMLYNFLHASYRNTGRPREAMKILHEMLHIFPNYLFGRIEYALYLLRRGEPERAHAALDNAETLFQLYPERKIFHAAEWEAFAYTLGLYWIQKGNINWAKNYLAIIQKISPNSARIKNLEQKMKNKLFLQSLEKLSNRSYTNPRK
jgi:hypothetical protein